MADEDIFNVYVDNGKLKNGQGEFKASGCETVGWQNRLEFIVYFFDEMSFEYAKAVLRKCKIKYRDTGDMGGWSLAFEKLNECSIHLY